MATKTKLPPLRVWWIPQVPMKPFTVPVENLVEAKLLLDTLAEYDRFQFENNVKPDYCNVGGVNMCEADGDWVDFYLGDVEAIYQITERLYPDYHGDGIDGLDLAHVREIQAAFHALE